MGETKPPQERLQGRSEGANGAEKLRERPFAEREQTRRSDRKESRRRNVPQTKEGAHLHDATAL